jgi:glycosyltransferase involved in cell wall biosynthesis
MVSVIIPTHNRCSLLPLTLKALAEQSYPRAQLEVIVVDDGSVDDTAAVVNSFASYGFKYVVQANQGATVARNYGAQHASGQWLVFMDDDIELLPGSLAALLETLEGSAHTIIVGALLSADPMERTGGIEVSSNGDYSGSTSDLVEVPATKCFTGLLGVHHADFIALGMFQDPTGGWPNWDDVDFGYRAQRAGYRLLRNRRAEAVHHDLAATNLEAAAKRWYRASQSAVRLMQKYPTLFESLPMFHDKTPIRWDRDSKRLVIRKIARRVVASGVGLQGLLALNRFLENMNTFPTAIYSTRRWIIGSYVYRGIHEGLKEYGPWPEQ